MTDTMIAPEEKQEALELLGDGGPITVEQAEAVLRVCWMRERGLAGGDAAGEGVSVSLEDLLDDLAAAAPTVDDTAVLLRMVRRALAWLNALAEDADVAAFDARMADDFTLIPTAAKAIAEAPLFASEIAVDRVYESFDLGALCALLGCERTLH